MCCGVFVLVACVPGIIILYPCPNLHFIILQRSWLRQANLETMLQKDLAKDQLLRKKDEELARQAELLKKKEGEVSLSLTRPPAICIRLSAARYSTTGQLF